MWGRSLNFSFNAEKLSERPHNSQISPSRPLKQRYMKANSIVIVNLLAPKERFFGRLLELTTAGVTVRGIDLNAFEDWMTNVQEHEESGVRPTTIFFPLHRVEKILLDENIGVIPSLSDTFFTKVGVTVSVELE